MGLRESFNKNKESILWNAAFQVCGIYYVCDRVGHAVAFGAKQIAENIASNAVPAVLVVVTALSGAVSAEKADLEKRKLTFIAGADVYVSAPAAQFSMPFPNTLFATTTNGTLRVVSGDQMVAGF